MPGTPDTPETILAFDFGLRRIGIAVGQDVTASANPLAAIRNSDAGPDWQAIETLVGEWRPSRLIVGMPLHEDGSPSEIGVSVKTFIAELATLLVSRGPRATQIGESGRIARPYKQGGNRQRRRRADRRALAQKIIVNRSPLTVRIATP
jgi:hypothetical protein